ncbi:MAG: 3-hydroxyacyl-ACP dehydratase FabZ [Gammaproteobacteria bacterium]
MEQMDIQEVMRYLPHRYPFLLIDKVISIELPHKLVALKNVTVNEPFFTGHFPELPVMPGVLIIEALAQASGILYYKSINQLTTDSNTINYLVGINEARFKQVVRPGDQLYLHVELLKVKQGLSKFQCKALVNDELVCSAEIMNVAKGIES